MRLCQNTIGSAFSHYVPPQKKVKKPGLSQARALIFPKDLVSLSNSISYGKDTL